MLTWRPFRNPSILHARDPFADPLHGNCPSLNTAAGRPESGLSFLIPFFHEAFVKAHRRIFSRDAHQRADEQILPLLERVDEPDDSEERRLVTAADRLLLLAQPFRDGGM
ncbi:hypothetical protein CA12_27130 [Alienimonas californiensis]|uniref:Uncharacterized protein n=1 Tax=Alienimonas californiensis TaxID=2527989 RepID=A0A517PB51_9PLAN|nr:hypothetical protein CA12_27130 [Alienimonas californiensis]